MHDVKQFMQSSLPAMTDYILDVSTPVTDRRAPPPSSSSEQHDRLHVMKALIERSPSLPTLRREAIPALPHLVDIPRHSAILVSAVVRSLHNQRNLPKLSSSRLLREFSRRCFDVENRALQCVTRLASRTQQKHATRPAPNPRSIVVDAPIDHKRVPSAPPTPTSPVTKASADTGKRRGSDAFRPLTAPSGSYSLDKTNLSQDNQTLRHTTHRSVTRSQAVDIQQEYILPDGLLRPEADDDCLVSPALSADISDDARRRKGFLRGFLSKR